MYKPLLVLAIFIASCTTKTTNPVISTTGFDINTEGSFTEIIDEGISIIAPAEHAEIYTKKGNKTPHCIHIMGGESKQVEIVNTTEQQAKYFSFAAERWTSRSPFKFKVEAYDGQAWSMLYKGDKELKTGHFPNEVLLPLPDSKEQRIRISVTSPLQSGALIDDITFFSDNPMVIDSVIAPYHVYPVLKRNQQNPVLNIKVHTSGFSEPQNLEEVTINTLNTAQTKAIKNVQVYYAGKHGRIAQSTLFATQYKVEQELTFTGNQPLTHGVNNIFVSYTLNEDASIDQNVAAQAISVKINGKTYAVSNEKIAKNHLGIALRKHNDQNVDTYRIPGLATTNKGTLIGVYDIRHNNGADLQEDIDVGMHRSTDGGQTWEPMKVIMDMKEWGGLPNDQNGIGDPSVLVDRATNTIWVAAVWAHGHPGQRNWWASKQGMKPTETSQFVLVKSDDDGKTWSAPINITNQIKDKKWHLLLQGPGKGITLKDGTLVFPAQFKDENQMPHSTIIWSNDHGKNWHIGTGAKPNTTEAQIIELNDGGLMLNMRDNRNGKDKTDTNGRAVAVTYNLGKTWKTHPTSNGALKEPTCMASLIKENFVVNGEQKSLVLFSNPNSKYGRHHMTIKVSLDDGNTWPEKHQLLIDSGGGRGYSCMTKIDDSHIGILYEGSQADLIFQVFSIEEIMSGN
ncbi:exo-alpha-sialidase [Puteibacter caeruleilacunae]|nr:exo-alpha-sialidase [Puteibacter caeruleilacunae]